MLKEYRLQGFKGLFTHRPATATQGGYLQKMRNLRVGILNELRKRYGDNVYISTDYRVTEQLNQFSEPITGDLSRGWPMVAVPTTGFVAVFPGGLKNYNKSWQFVSGASPVYNCNYFKLKPAKYYYENPSTDYGLHGSKYVFDADEYELLLRYDATNSKYILHFGTGAYYEDTSMPFAADDNDYITVPSNVDKGLSTECFVAVYNYSGTTNYQIRVAESYVLLPTNRYNTHTVNGSYAIGVAAVFIENLLDGQYLHIYVANTTQQRIDRFRYDLVARTFTDYGTYGTFTDIKAIYAIPGTADDKHVIFVFDDDDDKVYIYEWGTALADIPSLLGSFSLPSLVAHSNISIWGNRIHNYYNAYVLDNDVIYVGNSSVGYVGYIQPESPDDWVRKLSAKDDDYYRFVYLARPYLIDSNGNKKTYGPVNDANDFTLLKFQNDYILLRRGCRPLRYDGEAFKPLSINYKPSVSIAYAETTGEDPGDTLIFCYGDGSRMGPCAILKVPKGYAVSDISYNGSYEPAIKIKTLHEQYDDEIRLYGFILNENTGSQFISLFEDGYVEVNRGDYKEYYIDSTHGTPTVNLNGYSQYTLGQFGVLAPQHPCPEAGYGDIYKGRLFVANTPEYPNRVWWSDLNIAQFDLDYWWIDIPDEEPITGLKSFENSLYIFTESNVYTLTGTPPVFAIDPDNQDVRLDTGTLTLRQVVSGVGCINHHTIVETPSGLVFLSRKGVYLLTPGGALKELSIMLRDLFDDNDFDNATAVYWQGKYYLAFSSGELTDYVNDRLLIYDFEKKAWMMDRYPAGGMVYDSKDNEFYIGSAGDYKIYKYEKSGFTDNWEGTDVSAEFMTCEMDCGTPGLKKYFLRVYFDCQLTGSLTGTAFLVDVYIDNTQILSSHPIISTELYSGLPLPLSAYGEKIQLKLYSIQDEVIIKDIVLIYNTREIGGKVSETPSLTL